MSKISCEREKERSSYLESKMVKQYQPEKLGVRNTDSNYIEGESEEDKT